MRTGATEFDLFAGPGQEGLYFKLTRSIEVRRKMTLQNPVGAENFSRGLFLEK